MKTLSDLTILTVDRDSISMREVVKHLQTSGKLGQFVSDITRQYIIEKEIKDRNDIDINPVIIEQAIIDFRLRNKLNEPQKFYKWLEEKATSYEDFHASINFGFQLEKLKLIITENKLQEYFVENKISLDKVILSRIVLDNQELAEELHTQIEEGVSFEYLAREYSLTDDRIFNGMMGAISRGKMPDILRAKIDIANEGNVIGPIEIDGKYVLFRIEQYLKASLEDTQLKQALQNELFEKWLAGKIQKLAVKLHME